MNTTPDSTPVAAPTASRERPILFSGKMVRAILEGRKTQTRRIVKPQPEAAGFGRNCIVRPYCTGTAWPLAYYERRGACWNSSDPLRCPYGKHGDRLWVRETWAPGCDAASAKSLGRPNCFYRSTDGEPPKYLNPFKWRPPIFMPRLTSRITLEIEAVRVERLQDISDHDAICEGIPDYPDFSSDSPVHDYSAIWESINGRGSWDRNPWVWVIQFKRYELARSAESLRGH